MKYYLVAGERSGDLHAANLVKALRQMDPEAQMRGIGGDLLRDEGASLFLHYSEIAIMGFQEVIRKLPSFRKWLRQTTEDIEAFRPDAVILIDFGGFNLRLARRVKARGNTIFYYIPPKVWAWNSSRIIKLKRYTDHLLVILPFEKNYYQDRELSVTYVGNPLLDAIHQHRYNPFPSTEKVIAVLPGSREQEVRLILPRMVAAASAFPDHRFVVSRVDNLPRELYQPAIDAGMEIYEGHSYDLLHSASAALVTSGTATLETALHHVPQVVCYRSSPISYQIGRMVVLVNFISLVNLIYGAELVPELIQKECQREQIAHQLEKILSGPERERQLAGYKKIEAIIGRHTPSLTAAEKISELLA